MNLCKDCRWCLPEYFSVTFSKKKDYSRARCMHPDAAEAKTDPVTGDQTTTHPVCAFERIFMMSKHDKDDCPRWEAI